MRTTDRDMARLFLQTAFASNDWIAIFLKAYDTGRVCQHVAPVGKWCEARWQTWLAAMHQHRFNIYVSVNAIVPQSRRRTRESVHTVRHVFLDADHDGPDVLAAVRSREDLPPPSYVVHSSPRRIHLFWRVTDFTTDQVEDLQRRLAAELGTDPAATPCSQTTRLPGCWNLKYARPPFVTIDYMETATVYTPDCFPQASRPRSTASFAGAGRASILVLRTIDNVERARRYLASVPPAIAGQHGDAHTFRVCCRLVRGFALSDGDALDVLSTWNARCVPPWSMRELAEKICRARKYGREPIGGRLLVNKSST